jgi:2-phospho-L-lactate guanylyltransferase
MQVIFAVLPVKDPRKAKQRLNGVLSPDEREALARAMFEEVLAKLCAARGIDRVAVATSDARAAECARRAGALVFEEGEQRGHSESADAAARRAMELGARTVLFAPIDVPLATTAEFEELAAAARPGVIVVPSADGTGTNALVRTPPDVIPSRFGPGSFRKHCDEARARGAAVAVVRPPGLVFDIDTPEDAAELVRRAPECRAALLLGRICGSKS